jgi:hypothetical protein
MENYRIYFDQSERNEVIRIVRSYNDIIIDNIDDHSIGITIEREDSAEFYRRLMEEIDRDVYSMRTESGI